MKNIQNQLFGITLMVLLLGLIHISLAIIGALCFVIPFVLYLRYRDKVWCKYVCPRAGYFNRVIGKISLNRKPPRFMTKSFFKDAVVTYFTVNLIMVIMSTVMVSLGRIYPLEQLRFLIIFPVNLELPQLLNFQVAPPILHLGYRVYSMMLSSLTIGSILGILYRPRTWCAICPVNTLTTKSAPAKKIKT